MIHILENLCAGWKVIFKGEKLGDVWVSGSGYCERVVWDLLSSGVIYKYIYHYLGRIRCPIYQGN